MLKKINRTGVVPSINLLSKSRFSIVHKLIQADERERQNIFLDSENCILVNEQDEKIGYSSKRDCHKIDENQNIKLHRAFSVFLFNKKGEMLMQKRSNHKITFPNYYSNACCSHPLNDLLNENDEKNAIGIKRAAQRRLNFELGIPYSQVQPENFHYLTRVHYLDRGDGMYGEHEIDYILFLQKDVDVKPNSSEISEIFWVKQENIHQMIESLNGNITPWFRFILNSGQLSMWWNNLHRLKKFEDHSTIHKIN